jgi:hypothetical protein
MEDGKSVIVDLTVIEVNTLCNNVLSKNKQKQFKMPSATGGFAISNE